MPTGSSTPAPPLLATQRDPKVDALGLAWLVMAMVFLVGIARAADMDDGPDPTHAYEIAVIDKSLTGAWEDERAFRGFIRETFGDVPIRRFRFNSPEFRDWLEEDVPDVPRILCLLDGWTSAEIRRVDLRGSKDGKALRLTLPVKDRLWQEALRRAKESADCR